MSNAENLNVIDNTQEETVQSDGNTLFYNTILNDIENFILSYNGLDQENIDKALEIIADVKLPQDLFDKIGEQLRKDFNPKGYTIDELAVCELQMVQSTIGHLLNVAKSLPFCLEYQNWKSFSGDNEEFDIYKDTFVGYLIEFENMYGFLEKLIEYLNSDEYKRKRTERVIENIDNIENPLGSISEDKKHLYETNLKMMKSFKGVFSHAKRLPEIVVDKSDKISLLTAIDKFNKKLMESIQKLSYTFRNPIIKNEFENSNCSEIFDHYRTDFMELRGTIYAVNKIFDPQNLKENDRKANTGRVISTPQISDAEKERLFYINRANELYNELCLDFMRDLEKQFSLSSKDMYELFVNKKFKEFVKEVHMPLSNDVSVGYAKEVCGRIQNLMNYVTEISKNSYVTSVYGE